MKIVSVDCGSKNMAICVINADNAGNVTRNSVGHLERVSLHGGTISDLVKALKKSLDDRSILWDHTNFFVIEQQPASNIRMKVISHCIEMYWRTSNPNATITFSSARSALARVSSGMGVVLPLKMTYIARKKKSVEFATSILHLSPMSEVLAMEMKKDDCADALIHGAAWALKMGGSINVSTEL
jgi:hypothetical protein